LLALSTPSATIFGNGCKNGSRRGSALVASTLHLPALSKMMGPMTSPDLASLPRPAAESRLERAHGDVRLSFVHMHGSTAIGRLYQAGSAKVRFPRTPDGDKEAVLINTAGGLTGGDRMTLSVSAEAGTSAIFTTQAAERIYRRSAGVARIETRLSVARDASLDWIPHETIVFDRSALSRALDADIDPSARLIAAEATVLGRAAMGETVTSVALTDSWRIRRGGDLIFADGLNIVGDAAAIMTGGATGRGASAMATVVLVAPDAESRLDGARDALDSGAWEGGASAWNGMLVARLLAPGGQALRAGLTLLIESLRGRPMPRVWTC
jgi:urease accessory protein